MKTISKKLLNEFEKSINGWVATKEGEEDENLVLTYEQDRVDLKKVLLLLKKGKYLAAEKAASDLDTIVRDQIPSDLWDILQEMYDESQEYEKMK